MNAPVVSSRAMENIRDSIRRFDLGKWLIYLTFAIAFLIFLDAPILAMNWRNKPFPGFVVEQTLVVSDVQGDNWNAIKIGLDHPQRITQIAGKAVYSSEEFLAAVNELTVGQSIEIKTLLPDGLSHVYPSIPIQAFSILDLARMFWLP
jgi:hypothetical protein